MDRTLNSRFSFGTKGETLARLRDMKGASFHLCSQVLIGRPDWENSKNIALGNITANLASRILAVRSSAANEDGWDQSLAGVNLSLVNVDNSADKLREAVSDVFNSYDSRDDGDQVLIQPMVTDVAISGVVLSRDLDSGSPYFAINYDDVSGRTDTVTGGSESHTMLIYRDHPESIHSNRFRKLIDSVLEIEKFTASYELDIEFCITADERIYILQVRPLAARKNWKQLKDEQIGRAIGETYSRIQKMQDPQTGVAGNMPIFGVMPDWNPAEMIGTTPRPLALSLYKMLITDNVWFEARRRMGYRHVPHPLLIDFYGHPYIDVRLSLNSFLPDGLDHSDAQRLINHQLEVLAERRDLHDKIEFEIAITCKDFSYQQQSRQLRIAGLDAAGQENFQSRISALTSNALQQRGKGIDGLLDTARQLLTQNRNATQSLEMVAPLLQECKKNGTLPFSILARHAFIGVSFLSSLVERGALQPDDHDRFMHSIRTVASDFVIDMYRLESGEIGLDRFLSHYGHLRPGTYDILSNRYDSNPELYLGSMGRSGEPPSDCFQLSKKQEGDIQALIDEAGYRLSPVELLNYIRQVVKAREEAKFAFTRNISDSLNLLTVWGEENEYTREDLSYIPIDKLLMEKDSGSLRSYIEEVREKYELTRAQRLPHLICQPDDVYVVRFPIGRPTFITGDKITSSAIVLSGGENVDVRDKIVLIEGADPGYDWIFTYPIKGLITCYGGANSHMAIRCAEFGLPAAIGCGERMFHDLSLAGTIELNCSERKITAH